MNCVGHQSPGLAHPRDLLPGNWRKTRILVDSRVCWERGKFDGLFIADDAGRLAMCWNGNGDAAIRRGVQVPVNDPLALGLR